MNRHSRIPVHALANQRTSNEYFLVCFVHESHIKQYSKNKGSCWVRNVTTVITIKSQVRASSAQYTDRRYSNLQDADMWVSAIRVEGTTQIISLFSLMN